MSDNQGKAWRDGIRCFICFGRESWTRNPYNVNVTPDLHAEWEDGWKEAEFYGGWGFHNLQKD